jgi:hypothetical protein
MLRIAPLVFAFLALGSAPSFAADSATSATAVAVAGDKLPAPYLITDVGQGNTAKLVRTILKSKVTFEFKEQAKADELGDAKTIIIGVGASTKGLGAAGLDIDTETKRTEAILKAAKDKGIKVVAVHLGGQSRRGDLSDKLTRSVFEASAFGVVLKEGDEDQFFTKLADEKKLKIETVEEKAAAGAALLKLLNASEGAAK